MPKKSKTKVAIYGGAFDPITNSHMTVVAEVIHSRHADEVWIVPCGPRPDKPGLQTPAMQRYCMCQLAVNNSISSTCPVYVSDVEVNKAPDYLQLLLTSGQDAVSFLRGLTIDPKSGYISKVDVNSAKKGVTVGMQLKTVDGLPYTYALLEDSVGSFVHSISLLFEIQSAYPTYDLLSKLRSDNPKHEFVFIVGSDWLQPGTTIRNWVSRNPRWRPGSDVEKNIISGEKLLKEFDFLVIPRPGYDVVRSEEDPTGLKQFGPRMTWMDMPNKFTFVQGNLSSSEVRKRAQISYEDMDGLVPLPVLSFIKRQKLYARRD
jgi:nicotinic acid mononucleotide adenylyltransferase